MVIKGKARGNGAQLGTYLVSQGENERVEVIEVRGTCAPDVPGALREMDAVSICTRCEKPLYHASINTPIKERLTPEQRKIAVDRLERELGFTDQPRVVVVHEKADRTGGLREHIHIVWSRTDIEHQRSIRIDHNYRAHEVVSRELEREFGHERVQGAHIEREDRKRPGRTADRAEMRQAERTGLPAKVVKQQVTEVWQRSDTGAAFKLGLEEAGFCLARGDRRDFVVIDRKGGVHSLPRRIEGGTAKHVRERLADVNLAELPSVTEGRAQQKQSDTQRGLDRAQKGKETPSVATHPVAQKTVEAPQQTSVASKAADGVASLAGKVMDGLASTFEGLLGAGTKPRQPTKEEEIAAAKLAATAKQQADQAEQVRVEEEEKSKRRQAYMREFGRQIENEQEAGFQRERDRWGE